MHHRTPPLNASDFIKPSRQATDAVILLSYYSMQYILCIPICVKDMHVCHPPLRIFSHHAEEAARSSHALPSLASPRPWQPTHAPHAPHLPHLPADEPVGAPHEEEGGGHLQQHTQQ